MPRVAGHGPSSGTVEDEVLAAGRDGVGRRALDADLGDCGEFGMHRIAALSESRTHHPPAIVGGNVVCQCFSDGAPIASREVRREALGHLACRVFQLRRRAAELFELRERGVEVCLVEQFVTPKQIAVERENPDLPPFGPEALLRGPCAAWVTMAPRLLRRCTTST